jgi:transcriptional regulator with XRE-family HTH domain
MASEDSAWWFLKTMVRKHRIASGKSQREVGEAVYRSEDTIRAWELGRTDIPLNALAEFARACGIDDEIAGYMTKVAAARKKRGNAIEADTRFNALFLALAEEYCGFIFKFDALIIPGPLQLQEYHYIVVRQAEPLATEEFIDGGWDFKDARRATLESRTDRPTMQFLIGEAALLQLRLISEELYESQLAHLRRWARKPGVSIRVLPGPVLAQRSNFDIYMPAQSKLACPPFVYTEILDSSWCINDDNRIASYDEVRKKLWKMAIRIEDYRDDDRRDRMA